MDDAILAGIHELIERDAAGIWWYNQLALPAIELAGSADPYVRSLTASYRARGRECWGLDLTTDLGIPVVAAVSRWVDRTPEGFAVGLGADVDPAEALRRALVEMNQMLAVTRQFSDGAALEGRAALTGLAEQPQLLPAADREAARPSRPPPGDPLVHCRRTLTAHGLELLVLDQTRPDVALPTVRVIVPGLCSMWPRFGLSRLYQSPLRMKRRTVALDEGELNRMPLQL